MERFVFENRLQSHSSKAPDKSAMTYSVQKGEGGNLALFQSGVTTDRCYLHNAMVSFELFPGTYQWGSGHMGQQINSLYLHLSALTMGFLIISAYDPSHYYYLLCCYNSGKIEVYHKDPLNTSLYVLRILLGGL